MKHDFSMSRLTQVQRLAQVICVTLFGAGASLSARGGGAYLPMAGPSPLRFEIAAANPGSFALKMFSPPAKPTPVPATATNSAIQAVNVASLPSFPAPGTNSPDVAAVAASKPPANSARSIVSPLPDDSAVTPQMVAEYFQPAHNGTNQPEGAIAVPVNLGFLPPSAQAAQSRATYKIQ